MLCIGGRHVPGVVYEGVLMGIIEDTTGFVNGEGVCGRAVKVKKPIIPPGSALL